MHTATVDNSSLEYSSIAMANLAVRRAAAAIADTILRLRLTNTNATASDVKPPSLWEKQHYYCGSIKTLQSYTTPWHNQNLSFLILP